VLPDYDYRMSDVNSLVVLRKMDLRFLAFLAPLGKKHGKNRVAAPLVMTQDYLSRSLDSFPIEFLDFKLIHRTVYGQDILEDLSIEKPNLRLQCERELKTRLLQLRQGYISSLGKKTLLSQMLVRSITGSMALFRAMLVLLDREPPVDRAAVVKACGIAMKIDVRAFEQLLLLKTNRIRPSEQELADLFEAYHTALEAAERTIDDLRL